MIRRNSYVKKHGYPADGTYEEGIQEFYARGKDLIPSPSLRFVKAR